MESQRPLRRINSLAPIRIGDNGGWTDTWFAQHGRIFNIAVAPFVKVQLIVYPHDGRRQKLTIHAANMGERYTPQPGPSGWDRHPLIEAAIQRMAVPDNVALEVWLYSAVPAGAATGSSAAVCVALIGALDWLTPGRLSAREVAYMAHAVETEQLKQQSGIQDQLAAAYGGINFIEMYRYPQAVVTPVRIVVQTAWELEQRLALIYLGQAHVSSQVHEAVIQKLKEAGPTAQPLVALRQTAVPSRNALYAGDFAALGQAMIQNTNAQRDLHPQLVNADAERIIVIAQAHGALGWKVNGAGGAGGSLTLLGGPDAAARQAMIQAITSENPRWQNIPIALSPHGLRVWA